MPDFDYDLFVIGAGSGGLATAKRAASYGARVAIAESDRVGGTCVIRGCIPKKLMVYAAAMGAVVGDAAGYGWSHVRGAVDWQRLVERRNAAVASLEQAHEGHLARTGVELFRERARLVGANELRLEGRNVRARYILVAVGSAPVLPPIAGVEHAITSDGVFELNTQPERVAVVGAGYIAVEFASIFAGLGSRVTMLIRRGLPLTEFDEDLRIECMAALRARGVEIHPETTVDRLERTAKGLLLHLRSGDRSSSLETDEAVVYAIGRIPRTADLGLEDIGVDVGLRGEIVVDEEGRSSVESILAVGDVIARSPLTPVAIQAGRAIADRIFGGKSTAMSYEGIPTAVFSDPPIATVGLTELQARNQLGDANIAVFKSRFTPLFHTLTERKEKTLVKIVVDRRTDRVLGCHMIGHDAPEIIQGFAVAMKAGATKQIFDATVGIHPSVAEELVTLS